MQDLVDKSGKQRLEYMIEIGDSKGEFPATPHRDKPDADYDTPEEAIEFAVKIMKTYFESMSDQEYDCTFLITNK